MVIFLGEKDSEETSIYKTKIKVRHNAIQGQFEHITRNL